MSVQFNPNTMQRRADGPLPFGRTQLDQVKPNEATRSGTSYRGQSAAETDFPTKHDIPTTLLNERMNDGEINCLERAIHQSAEGDTLVFLDDRHNVDGNRAGHVLIRDGETGRLRDPSSNQAMEEFDSLDAWNQDQKTSDVQPDPYVKSGELEATEVKELMKLSPEQRRAYVAESGNAELKGLANDRFADTSAMGAAPGLIETQTEDDAGLGTEEPAVTRSRALTDAMDDLHDAALGAAVVEYADLPEAGDAFAAGDAAARTGLNEVQVLSDHMNTLAVALKAVRVNNEHLTDAEVVTLKSSVNEFQQAMKRLAVRTVDAQINTTRAVASQASAEEAAAKQAEQSKLWAIAGLVGSFGSLGLGAGNALAQQSKGLFTANDGAALGFEATGAARATWLATQEDGGSTTQTSGLTAEEIADAEATITNMGGLYEELGLMGSHNNNGGQEISNLRSGLFTATTTYGKANTAAGQEAIALSQMQNLRDADGGPAIGVVDKDGFYRADIVVEYMGRGTNDPQIVNLPEGESASDFTIVKGAQAKGAITVLEELGYDTRQIPTELPARRGPDTRYNPFDVTVSNESVDSDSARFGIIQSAGLTHWDYDKEINYEGNFDLVADPWSGVDDESATEALWSGYNALAINEANEL